MNEATLNLGGLDLDSAINAISNCSADYINVEGINIEQLENIIIELHSLSKIRLDEIKSTFDLRYFDEDHELKIEYKALHHNMIKQYSLRENING